MENAVFLELRRKEHELFYHHGRSSECDFIIVEKAKVTQAIQVTYQMDDEKTRTREIKGLIDACKAYDLDEGIIISYDQEELLEIDGVKVSIIPLIEFLLAKE